MPPTSPRKFTEADEKEREALKRGLKDVGENLPHDPVEVEGADVDRMVRHKDDAEESEEDVVREQLEDPHPDVDRETAEELELEEED